MTTAITIPINLIKPSGTNPRRNFDQAKLDELAASLRQHGMLQPVLVRANWDGYELVAGERRMKAAAQAGLTEVPAIVRELADVEVLEIQIIENSQRDDLHPLEEARGYRALVATKQYDVARIAGRTGHSVRYVYDRLRLLDLIPEAKKLFLAGTITAGHAVLLSRLSAENQELAIDRSEIRQYRVGGLFQAEHQRGLRLPTSGTNEDLEDEDDTPAIKARSVREFAAWIDEHCRLEPTAPDLPDLFPETADVVEKAQVEEQKVVLITRANFIPEEARAGDRVIGPRSWRRADGSADRSDPQGYEWKGYKPDTCDHSVMGFVAVGPGRGEAFLVCTEKKKCKTHWAEEKASPSSSESRAGAAATKREEARKAENARIEKALPALRKAMVEAMWKAPADAKSVTGKHVIDWQDLDRMRDLPPLKTAEDIVRSLAANQFMPYEHSSFAEIIEDFKAFGLDARAILDEHAPIEKLKAPVLKKKAPAKAKAKRKATAKK